MTIIKDKIVMLLDRVISKRLLAPRVEDKLKEYRDAPDGFYQRELKNKSSEEAEKLLARVFAERCYYEFSGSLESIAAGLKCFTEANSEVHLLPFHKVHGLPGLHDFRANNTVIAFNPLQRGCGCSQVDGSPIFGYNGSLNLMAITMNVDESERNASVGLVFKVRDGSGSVGYCIITFFADGSVCDEAVTVYFRDSRTLEALELFRHRLGIEVGNFGDSAMLSSSDVEGSMGFPGAKDYLAKQIGQLGPYLVAVSQNIDHKHS